MSEPASTRSPDSVQFHNAFLEACLPTPKPPPSESTDETKINEEQYAKLWGWNREPSGFQTRGPAPAPSSASSAPGSNKINIKVLDDDDVDEAKHSPAPHATIYNDDGGWSGYTYRQMKEEFRRARAASDADEGNWDWKIYATLKGFPLTVSSNNYEPIPRDYPSMMPINPPTQKQQRHRDKKRRYKAKLKFRKQQAIPESEDAEEALFGQFQHNGFFVPESNIKQIKEENKSVEEIKSSIKVVYLEQLNHAFQTKPFIVQ